MADFSLSQPLTGRMLVFRREPEDALLRGTAVRGLVRVQGLWMTAMIVLGLSLWRGRRQRHG